MDAAGDSSGACESSKNGNRYGRRGGGHGKEDVGTQRKIVIIIMFRELLLEDVVGGVSGDKNLGPISYLSQPCVRSSLFLIVVSRCKSKLPGCV